MLTRKRLSDEEKEKLRRMLRGDLGHGTYKGHRILSDKPAGRICRNCGNRLYKIKLADEKMRKKGNLLLPFVFISIGIGTFMPIIIPAMSISSARILSILLTLIVFGGLVVIGSSIIGSLVGEGNTKIVCKGCDDQFLDHAL